MSHVLEKMGRDADAAAALDKARKIYAGLLGPDHERTRAAADELARLRRTGGA